LKRELSKLESAAKLFLKRAAQHKRLDRSLVGYLEELYPIGTSRDQEQLVFRPPQAV
jgi:hypothetical protein